MSESSRVETALKALRELGLRQMGLYALYQFGLKSGYYRRVTPPGQANAVAGVNAHFEIPRLFDLPGPGELARTLSHKAGSLITEAEEIVSGRVRLFGGDPVPLQLTVPGELRHWTFYPTGQFGPDSKDIKYIWEPARFEWAYTLARAYRLTADETYSQTFWRYTESFLDANPANLGPHWISAQEVALRLIAFVFASQVFAGSPASTRTRIIRLAEAIAAHAARIPPTLPYARAQNNNHLLSEAAGLLTAGLFLSDHPSAPTWRNLGWKWFNFAVQSQFDTNGVYAQHSTNYHRLALQVALWVHSLVSLKTRAENTASLQLSGPTLQRLAAGTRWLLAMVDSSTGRAPNLGPNDGAYILPLSACPYWDYRPVLQAASKAFLGERVFPGGPWDEMVLWMGGVSEEVGHNERLAAPGPSSGTLTPCILTAPNSDSWAYLRAAHFQGRPGHADQLHLDLWFRGCNLAQDPGTYLYNAPPPWDNALASSAVHNTLTVDGLDQMTRAGRFLWLDWAQGAVLQAYKAQDGSVHHLIARHDGFKRIGVIHLREVIAKPGGTWSIEDRLSHSQSGSFRAGQANKRYRARLQWLLPDWPWRLETVNGIARMQVESPFGWVELNIRAGPASSLRTRSADSVVVQLVRAGELLSGKGEFSPVRGWYSPTYGYKIPALSLSFELAAPLPVTLASEWNLP